MKTKSFLLYISVTFFALQSRAQITLLEDYQNHVSAAIGTFQGINFRDGGFSGIFPIPNTNGTEFWVVSDKGVNVDCANANPAACHPTYDNMCAFPGFSPSIYRIRLKGTSVEILKKITIKRPNGTAATGLLNPTGFGSTSAEITSTDTVLDCSRFHLKTAAKDIWGMDAEGLVVDKDGNFWVCEEGGPTIWKLNANGVVQKRYSPYTNLAGAQSQDIYIDSVYKYRKNNRGFEALSITPQGKIYAMIQSPILYPNASAGENSRVHRLLEIDPLTDAMKMYAYLNDGPIGSGDNEIRHQDWKIGDMASINDSTFLIIEAGVRGTTDRKNIYLININGVTVVHSGLYGGKTLEALVDSAGLAAEGIKAVKKSLFLNLLSNGWDPVLDKPENLAIINDSTIAVGNDNEFGQVCPNGDGIAITTDIKSHVIIFGLKGNNKIPNYRFTLPLLSQGNTGPNSSSTPYLEAVAPGVLNTAILTVGDSAGMYRMVGIPDGLGAFDNDNGTFTLLMNHELVNTSGVTRAHGSKGAFVSKWIIKKSDLSVLSGSDLIKEVNLWNGSGYNTFSSTNPSASAAFNRLCSADLPEESAFFNVSSKLGTRERIFMSGEEAGAEGRGFAHILTGPNAGTSWQLPFLGRISWENSMACPFEQNKTIVAGTDDASPGQVYFYIGVKTQTGNEIVKAGLTNGKLFGCKVNGLSAEVNGSIPSPGTAFSMHDLGQVHTITGAQLNTASNSAGVTNFLRPEDGAWDPGNPSDFYFTTTNAFASLSRLWKLHFTDIANPESGGTITAVLDGTEGHKMLDNMTIDHYGHILLQEDVGNNARLCNIWQYTIATDSLKLLNQHDPSRFISGGAEFLTQDEESSGIIDMENILGPGMFLCDVMSHHALGGELVEGGQLLALFNPETYNSAQCGAGIPVTANEVTGNIKLTTQTEMNAFYSNVAGVNNGKKWTKVVGNLLIDGGSSGDPITNLCNLMSLTGVTGDLYIHNFNKSGNPDNLDKLTMLREIGCGFEVRYSTKLKTLNLPSLKKVGCSMLIIDNANARSLIIPAFESIAGEVINVSKNPKLETIKLSTAASSFKFLGPYSGNVKIADNGNTAAWPLTMNFKKFKNLKGYLEFINNDNSGVSNFDDIFSLVDTIKKKLTITNNDYLNQCCIAATAVVKGVRTISGNTGNCLNSSVVITNCGAFHKRSVADDNKMEQSLSFEVYPNPGDGRFKIRVSGVMSGTLNMTVSDMLGRVVFAESLSINESGISAVELNALPPGQYIMKSELNGQQWVKRVFIKHLHLQK